MLVEFGVAAASYAFVFLKAFQQRNVVFNNYLAVMPISFLMAMAEVYVIGTVALRGWEWGIVAANGIGAGLGCITAMVTHHHIFIKPKQVLASEH